jgi:acetyl-CoA acetyltransferase
MVSAGAYEIVLALGVEKLYHEDKQVSFRAFSGAVDVEALAQIMAILKQNAEKQGASKAGGGGAGEKRSMFMDIYAAAARTHMQLYGSTARQFAAVSAKNSFHR